MSLKQKPSHHPDSATASWPEATTAESLSLAQAATALRAAPRKVQHWLSTGELEMVLVANGQQVAVSAQSVRALQREHRLAARQSDHSRGHQPSIHTAAAVTCQPLIDVLSEIPDFRLSRGRRYGLSATLTLACTAMLCGCRTYAAIAQWGRYYGGDIVHELGFTRSRIPCALTFCLVFGHLGAHEWEARLSQWTTGVAQLLPARSESEDTPSSPGSNALRDTMRELTNSPTAPTRPRTHDEAAGVSCLAPLGRRLGLHLATLPGQHVTDRRAPRRTPPETVAAVDTVLSGLVLDGQLVTVEMLLPDATVRPPLRQHFE